MTAPPWHVSGPPPVLTRRTHAPAKVGDAAMVDMLLRMGADPAQANSAGETAGHVARNENIGYSHWGVQILAEIAKHTPWVTHALGYR